MKQLYKLSGMATLLLMMAVNSTQAQLVVNYQNDQDTQETTQYSQLTVVKNGASFFVNNILDVSRINYIAPFISADTNEGTVTLPESAELKPQDITVIGDTESVTVDENGNFQTTANNLIAVNKQGKMVYRTIVSMEEGEQMRQADMNAMETAVSLLMPMFSNIFQGMPDYAIARLKKLIAEMPETTQLSIAIDNSIINNGYLNMADIENEFNAATKKIGEVSGLSSHMANNSHRAGTNRAASNDAEIELKSLTRADVTVYDMIQILKDYVTINGYKGLFNVWNKSRISYSAVKTGRKMLDDRYVPVNDHTYECPILPPVFANRFVGPNTTWDDIKAFITGASNAESADYEDTIITDVALDFSTDDDVIMIAGPKDDTFLQLYNVTRTNMAVVVTDIMNILKNGGGKVQDQFYYDFVSYLNDYVDYDHPVVDPDEENRTDPSYINFFKNTYQSGEYTVKQKMVRLFKATFPLLRTFIQEGAEKVQNEQTKALLSKMNTATAEIVFNNYDLYLAMISAYGDNTLGAHGLEEGNSSYAVEGLQGIVQPTPTANDIINEMEKIYDLHVYYGCKSDFFYKLQMAPGTHTTLDTQGIGWDHEWNIQGYSPTNDYLLSAFDLAYTMIGAINELLADLAKTPNVAIEAEARALRAWYYIYLAENWRRVSLRDAGETLITYCNKPYAKTDDEMWDFIINDLTMASQNLNWYPRDFQQGRCTKGMALAYLGEAYLWKAYKTRENGGNDHESITSAKTALEQVMDSNEYELAPSFSTLWDGDIEWPQEAIWQFANEMNPDPGNEWSRNDWFFTPFYTASPLCGGWGSEFMSWELYFLYEQGDKRRDASLCTLPVEALPQAYRSAYCYGRNPYTQETIDNSNLPYKGYLYQMGGDFPAGIWTTKLWRLKRASWNASSYAPVHIYFKRYAGVLLDYAECRFRLFGGDDPTAWDIINQIRKRAFGNNEINLNESDYINYFNQLVHIYGNSWSSDDYQPLTGYPIPFNRQEVSVEDAKTYYNRMAEQGLMINLTGQEETLCKPFTGKAEAWQVAIGQERRKEFSSEWNLKADLQRLEFMPAHIDCNYPMGVGTPTGAIPPTTEWHTYRGWVFDANKMYLPIPQAEMNRNREAIQNTGY